MAETDSFLAALLRKSATVQQTANERGLKPVKTDALQKEVERQIKQVTKRNKGNIVTGEGVTKSGGDDNT